MTSKKQNTELRARVVELEKALHEGRRAIGDHNAPSDCYATGPLTGDNFRDLVECPACAFIATYDTAIRAKNAEWQDNIATQDDRRKG